MKSSSLEHSEQGHAFLQRRVALYGFHGANIGLALLVFRIVESVIHGHVEWTLYTPSVLYHFLGALSFVAMWLMIRKRTESWIYWIVVDVVGVGLYWAKDVRFVSMLYVILLALATRGLVSWLRAGRAPAHPAGSGPRVAPPRALSGSLARRDVDAGGGCPNNPGPGGHRAPRRRGTMRSPRRCCCARGHDAELSERIRRDDDDGGAHDG